MHAATRHTGVPIRTSRAGLVIPGGSDGAGGELLG